MEKDVIITYETLYEIMRREKFRPELQVLNKEFFEDLVKYFNEKKSILESQQKKKSIFTPSETQKTQKQIENIKKIIRELYEKRENKIIQLAMFASRNNDNPLFQEMLPEERKFFKELLGVINNYRKNILYNLIEGKHPEIKQPEKPKELKTEKKDSIKMVRFLQSIPKFIGTDLNIYGPFEEEEIAALPSEVVDLLTKKKKTEVISTK
jgi:DNA replication initiation complex subunit (GINS family)